LDYRHCQRVNKAILRGDKTMKERFVQFLFKRISSKMDDVSNAYDNDDLVRQVDDLEMYVNELKEIVMEVLKP
jgi:predicted site-specific integrase-resolvase